MIWDRLLGFKKGGFLAERVRSNAYEDDCGLPFWRLNNIRLMLIFFSRNEVPQ